MYRIAVGMWGIDPQSFWKMTLREWWFVQDAKNSERCAIIRASGKLTNSDYDRLHEKLKAAKND
jgi:hypothetical protein